MADDICSMRYPHLALCTYIVALCASELVLFLHTVRTALTQFLIELWKILTQTLL